jgi:CsoR family transcriptional regulator, copper-sensing transcriptional repressor
VRFDDRSVEDALARLRKVEGQVAGVIRMIEDGRDCAGVVQQLAAARRALDRAGLKLLASGLESCLADQRARGIESGVPEEFERLFMTLT